MQIIGLSFLCCCPIGNIISAYYWRATRGDKIWIKIRKLIHLTDWKKKENEKKQKDKKELFLVTFIGCIWISLVVNLHWSSRNSRTFRKMTKRKQWQLEMFSHLMNLTMMMVDEWKDTLEILATQVQMVWMTPTIPVFTLNLDERRRDSSDDEGPRRKRDQDDDPEAQKRREKISTKDDLMPAKVSRLRLSQWLHMPWFQNTIAGCYVRVNVGGIYRIAEIAEVTESSKIYSLGQLKKLSTTNLEYQL